MKTAWIFPAFISENIGNEDQILSLLSSDFDGLLKIAAEVTQTDLNSFKIETNDFLAEENKNQYISYVFSCAVVNILKRRGLKPDFLSGLSMGIYAALYTGNSISYEDGLRCIKEAYELSVNRLNQYDFGMGAIIGLTHEELDNIVLSISNDVDIVNTNGIYSYVISGISSDVKQVALKARTEGAFHSGLLDVSCPYHSKFMKDVASEFHAYVNELSIETSEIPLVSLIDQSTFRYREEIAHEMARNLDSEINWYRTMQTMIELGIQTFIECGAGKSLYKMGKFIEGDFSILPINKLPGYLNS